MDPKTKRRILDGIDRARTRSPLFWWFVENHDDVEARAAGKRVDWIGFCESLASSSLTDINGRAPTPALAKLTWHRAKRAVATARAREQDRREARAAKAVPARAAFAPVVPVAGAWPVLQRNTAPAEPENPVPVRTHVFDLSDPALTDEERRNLQRANEDFEAAVAKHDAKFRRMG